MRQRDKFICISYSQIDFLIPNDYVVSAVGVKDVQIGMMHNENSGIFDFENGLKAVCTRGKVMSEIRVEDNGKMASIAAPAGFYCNYTGM